MGLQVYSGSSSIEEARSTLPHCRGPRYCIGSGSRVCVNPSVQVGQRFGYYPAWNKSRKYFAVRVMDYICIYSPPLLSVAARCRSTVRSNDRARRSVVGRAALGRLGRSLIAALVSSTIKMLKKTAREDEKRQKTADTQSPQ